MAEQMSYPWYSIFHGNDLEQGDILCGFEIPEFQRAIGADTDEYEVVAKSLDVVIMTQSCDLQHNKARSVVLCPVIPLKDFVSEAIRRGEEHWKKTEQLDRLRQGNLPGYHLISDYTSADVSLDLSIVDFHELYSASILQVRSFVSTNNPRLRLCPPYKEHLAQSFARFFMRVGLPVDISREKVRSAVT